MENCDNNQAYDASKESYVNWWDNGTNHVVCGTKGSIQAITEIKAERDALAEEVEALKDTIQEAQNCLACAEIGNPFEIAQTALDILDRAAGRGEEVEG